MIQNRVANRPLNHPNNGLQRAPNSQHNIPNRPGQPNQMNQQNRIQRPGTMQQQPHQQQQQQQPPNQVPLPNVIPKGWKREEIVRTKGITAGLSDTTYVCLSEKSELAKPGIIGKKFKSKFELNKIFGEKYDTSLLDFKRGKISQLAYRKHKRNKNLQANPQNYISAAKYDNYLTLPTRQTASIIKQSVSYVTNNHKNDETPNIVSNFQTYANNPTSLQNLSQNQLNVLNKNSEKPKPNQLFWEFHFNDLKAVNANLIDYQSDIKDDLNIEIFTKLKNLEVTDENVMRSVAVSWYMNQNKVLVGQDPKEFDKNCRVFIERDQPLIPMIKIKEDDLKDQENKIKQLRKAIQDALNEYENVDLELLEKELKSLNKELFNEECQNGPSKLEKEVDSVKNEMQIDEEDEIVEIKDEIIVDSA
ncbi:unnamed protein product [Brachionus calyciflorus]|uniref:MBD domain-containing protein n=1 Tax=Brachionus calyciflorus TaxID=104777 RepID=A0A813N4D8_9BILA|nr:unnamed protein product [Brachionus calyciflorus]